METPRARTLLPGLGFLMATLGGPDSLAGQGAWAKLAGLEVTWDVVDSDSEGFEILSWSWSSKPGAEARLALGPGELPPAGSRGEIVISKNVDAATPQLMTACAKGTHLEVVELAGPLALTGEAKERADRSFPGLSKYQSIKLSRARVTSFSLIGPGTAGNSTPVETIVLSYERIDYGPDPVTPKRRVAPEPR